MLSNSEKVIKCMLAMLDGRSGKGYNNYIFLGSIYGVGDVYSDLSIVKRNASLYDFKSELITKLMKYKLLGIDGVYLINDIIALDFNKYRDKNIPSGIDAVLLHGIVSANNLKLSNKYLCIRNCDNISITRNRLYVQTIRKENPSGKSPASQKGWIVLYWDAAEKLPALRHCGLDDRWMERADRKEKQNGFFQQIVGAHPPAGPRRGGG